MPWLESRHRNRWLAALRLAISLLQRPLLYVWIGFHLLFIFLMNAVTVYSSYQEFHQRRDSNRVASVVANLLNKAPARFYGRYTGAETGYGFFGINVRSNGIFLGECEGKVLTPDLRSYETTLRFFSMGNSLTDDFIKPGTQDSLSHHPAADIMNDYNQLVLRNIAVTLFQQHHCQDTAVALSYNLLDFPTLAAVRAGAAPQYSQVKLITVNYSLQPYAR
ncbi:hypothetical protein KTO58_04780 [Chitinophaga pendula]|uniref:hypothetical protein n=1 Tax=Chitinophaga TaxID=79328 RepID=UPI0012FD9B77|nr:MULTISPECIES: hypothetical protein [Chitinophaga]UCJ08508.1 hypothetical protein KTO58_04780 [Chitinophaga pendula]